MQKHIKNLLQANSLLIAVFVTILIAFLSLVKLPKTTVEIHQIDKLYHCIAYFVFSLFWLFYTHKKIKISITLVLCIIYGIIIEVLQSTLTNYRSGDFIDILANTIGTLIAFIVFKKLNKS